MRADGESSASSTEITIGHNVGSKETVQVMELAQKVGAKIVDPLHDTFWGGYSGHFMDSDGHLWEVAWNPEWALEN